MPEAAKEVIDRQHLSSVADDPDSVIFRFLGQKKFYACQSVIFC